ncbi:MAG: hypothetical protein IPM29_27985 [Planctomycetes bacterium]|nr:hypothetical protein [Planctomycetota bacterium]
MDSEPRERRSARIKADAVRSDAPAVLVDPGHGLDAGGLTVVPIAAGGRVAGFEIRCRCGCRAIVECLEDARGAEGAR